MNTGPDGIELMHYFEQCRLTAYPDPASEFARTGRGSPEPVTIGWGDTGGWKLGDTITQQEADERFERRLRKEFEPFVRNAVLVPLTQKQFDAMVSIVYNTGPGGPKRDGIIRLASGTPSTLLRKLNAGDYAGAAAQFPAWNRSGGRVMKGLQRRREAERLVFEGVDAGDAIRRALKAFP